MHAAHQLAPTNAPRVYPRARRNLPALLSIMATVSGGSAMPHKGPPPSTVSLINTVQAAEMASLSPCGVKRGALRSLGRREASTAWGAQAKPARPKRGAMRTDKSADSSPVQSLPQRR